MGPVGEAFVRVRAETSGLSQEVSQEGTKAGRAFASSFSRSSRGAFGDFNKEATQATRGAVAGSGAFAGFGRAVAFASGTFLGTAGLVAGIKQSISAASNLNESTSKSRVLFGAFSRDLERWAKTTSDSFGLASDQALDFAGSFGGILRPLGVAQEEAAQQSKKLTELGADLASFYNSSVADALVALKSGIVGESEPLRRFGILLSETRVQAEAVSSGLVKTAADAEKVGEANTKLAIAQAKAAKAQQEYGAGTTQVAQAQLAVAAAQRGLEKAMGGGTVALTDQQKVMARLSLIFKDAQLASGDFARTSEGQANLQRRLAANIRETEIAVGKALMPTVTNATKSLNDWLGETENQARVQDAVTEAVRTTAGVVRTLWGVMKTGVGVIRPVVDAVGGLKNALELLVALKLASWFAKTVGGMSLIAGDVAAGTGAAGAAGQVAGLRGKLLSLAKIGAITVGIDLLFTSKGDETAIGWGKKVLGGALVGGAVAGVPGAVAGALAVPAFRAGQAFGAVVFGDKKGFDPAKQDITTTIEGRPASPLHAPEAGAVVSIGGSGRQGGQVFWQVVFLGKSGAVYTFNNVVGPTGRGEKSKGAIIGHVPAGGKVIFHYAHPTETRVPSAGGTGVEAQTTPPSGAGGADTHRERLKSAFPAGERGANLDWEAKRGTTVGAPEAGRIWRITGGPAPAVSTTGGSYGWSIYLLADSGNYYYMTHFAKLLVSRGQKVSRGTALGVVAGHVSKDHIHIEMAGAGFVVPGAGVTVPGGAGSSAGSAAAAAAAAGAGDTLTVGEAATSGAAADVIGQGLANQLKGAERAVKLSATKPLSVQEAAIRAQIVVDEKVIAAAEAYLKKHPKAKDAVNDVVQGARDDIASLTVDLARLAQDEAKEAAKGRAHQKLVDQVLAGLGLPTSAMATRAAEVVGMRYQNMTTEAVKAVLAAQKKAKAQLAVAVQAAQAEEVGAVDIIGTLTGLDPNMKVTSTDKWGRQIDTTVGAIVAKAQKLLRNLESALGSGNKAAINAAVKAWQDYGGQIGAAVGASLSAAQQVAEAKQTKFHSAFASVSGRILTAFDRETQRAVAGMQASMNAQITGLQAALTARLAKMQADLQAKVAQLQARGARLTPAERQLQGLQLQQSGESAMLSLQQAHAALLAAPIGSTEALAAQQQIDALMLQQKISGLQASADAERAARDKETQTAIDAATTQEQAKEKALQDEEAALERTLAAEEAARELDYADQRDSLRTHLAEQLVDWEAHLADRSKSWSDFTAWLAGEGASGDFGPNPVVAMTDAGQTQGSAFARAYIAELQAAYRAQQEFAAGQEPTYTAPKTSYGSTGGTGHGIGHQGFASGGEIPGPAGRIDDRFALVSPGETVIDRRLTNALKAIFVDGRGPAGAEVLLAILRELRRQTGAIESGPPVNVTLGGGPSANEIAMRASR